MNAPRRTPPRFWDNLLSKVSSLFEGIANLTIIFAVSANSFVDSLVPESAALVEALALMAEHI